ncbi:thiamine pyrophosphate-binding protein [Alphaproteobacteria bacterium]|nr:thiamine pyrophosphate-binding protein [Alphaproteobacteria bacterium]
MAGYNVGDLVAEFLHLNGVENVFGVVSVHNIPMLDAIGRRNFIRMIPARGEMGAGHMADGYARSVNGLGVVFTSTGPGAANAAGSIVEARFAGSPVIHFTGQTATSNLDKNQGTVHDVPNQLGMLQSISKKAIRINNAEEALTKLKDSVEIALTAPMGPVSVEIPIDIQRTNIERPLDLDQIKLPIINLEIGDTSSIDKMESLILSSKRKILWVGNGGKYAKKEIKQFVDMGFVVVTSTQGRGVISEENKMCLGAFNAVPLIEDFYNSLDLMIVVGSRLRGHETRDMSLQLPQNIIQIDIDPNAQNRTYNTDHFHCGDAKKVLNELIIRLSGKLHLEDQWVSEVNDLKMKIIHEYKNTLGAYKNFPEIVRKVLPENGRWVRDVTISNSMWGNRLMPITSPEENIYPVGAAIGPGMALAIGASIGSKGKKTIAMCGDGGFMLNLPDLWTAAETNCDVVFLVMNDQGYGVIKHIQESMYGGRKFFADLIGPNFEDLSKVAKIKYKKIKKADELEKSLDEAVKFEGPVLVEVDVNSVGEMPRYFMPPPHALKK